MLGKTRQTLVQCGIFTRARVHQHTTYQWEIASFSYLRRREVVELHSHLVGMVFQPIKLFGKILARIFGKVGHRYILIKQIKTAHRRAVFL